MSKPRAITITFSNIPDQLHNEVSAHAVKSRAVTNLLNELVQLRLDRASSDAIRVETDQEDRVRALELDLAGAQSTVEKLRSEVVSGDERISELRKHIKDSKESRQNEKAELVEARGELRKALSHAIALINHLHEDGK